MFLQNQLKQGNLKIVRTGYENHKDEISNLCKIHGNCF